MRTWLWTLVLFTAAVVLAVVLRENTGHMLILVNDWRLQVSLAFAVVSLIGLFVCVYVVLRLTAWITALPMRMRGWSSRRHIKRDQELLEQGWTELLEGRYSHAEKDLTKLFDRSTDASRQVLAALSAARAAHALGEFGRRDHLITLAKDKAAENSALQEVIATAAADLYLDQGSAAQALEALLPVQQRSARHIHTLRLLLRAHRQLDHHEQVYALAHTLNRRGALHETEARKMIAVAAASRLRETMHTGDWHVFWKALKADERTLTEVALAGAAAFELNGQSEDASRSLEQAISLSFDSRLLAAYAQAEPTEVKRRLEKAEAWVQVRPNDAVLLASLGQLCLVGQLWGQAESYLTRSLSTQKDARVHVLLGSLYDKLSRPLEAIAQWRLAAAMGTTLPTLAVDTLLLVADTASDPGVIHAEGLAYLSESGFPVNWDRELTIAPTGLNLSAQQPESMTQHHYDEYFDNAPVSGLGEPAPVTPLVPIQEKKI